MSRVIDPREQHARRRSATATMHMRETLDARAHSANRRAAELVSLPGVPLVGCPLSDTELLILRYVAEGLTNGQIATARTCSEQSIKNHVTRLLRKLGALNRADAVRQMDDTWPGWRTGVHNGEATMPVREVIRQLRTLADRLEWEAKRSGAVA